jgi:NAD(P)-dependent dehydrogenase (short-subunit alcohol dehydrogenase family)
VSVPAPPRSAIVFGARNLGHAIIEALVADGCAVTGVARSEATLQGVSEAGARPQRADITDPASVRAALAGAAEAQGPLDLAVNAASPYAGGGGPFGGGPIADTAPDAFDRWTSRPAQGAFSFLSAAGRFTLDQRRPATLIQVTGGSARRAMPGRGLWAAGSFGVRAITNAAALELRPQGIQVVLLIIDAGIEPRSGEVRAGASRDALADADRIADAVLFLARQDPRAATHELTITPLAEGWTP